MNRSLFPFLTALHWMLALTAMFTSFSVVPTNAQPARPDASDRFVLCGNYCGLVDGTGSRIGDRVFEHLDDFKGPVAVYTRNQKYGAIDRLGRRIIKPVHDTLWSPANGFLVAENKLPSGTDSVETKADYTLFDALGNELLHLRGDFRFGGWGNHVYYQTRCSENGVCPTIFLDVTGKPVTQFSYFDWQVGERLAVASPGGGRYGFVDETLRFVIPPLYRSVDAFKRDVTRVSTAAGAALIDRQGHELVAPGLYSDLYVWENSSFITALRADLPNCALYIRPDGEAIRLPEGICADGAEYVDSLGYAFVRDDEGRRGIIDERGRILIRPYYPWLRPLNDRYLVAGDDATRPKLFEVVDRQGEVVLPKSSTKVIDYSSGCCFGPGDLRDILIGVSTEGTVGLLGLDGKWIIPAQYKEARVIAPDIVAMRNNDDRYRFFTSAGKSLPLVSDSEPSPLSRQTAEAGGPFFFSRIEIRPGVRLFYEGLAGPAGQILIPSEYAKIEDAGDNLLALWAPGPEKIGFADRSGRIIAEPQFTDLITPFRRGAAVVRNRQGDTILLGEDGKTIASFAALFPDIANSGGGFDQVDQALDVCIDPDPSAEPEEKPSQKLTAQKICRDPALRAQSREAEKDWRSALTGDCLPGVFIALRPAYDQTLADCADGTCVGNAMRAFRQQIAKAASHCTVSSGPDASKFLITESLRDRLTKRLASEAISKGDEIEDENGQVSIDLQPIALGQHQGILAVAPTTAHNGPIWLFLRNPRGGWDLIFDGYAGYLRPLEATSTIRNGLPVLRTQQHVSCCEHSVEFYAYDGKAYKPALSCTQLYDADETPLLFCDDEKKDNEEPEK